MGTPSFTAISIVLIDEAVDLVRNAARLATYALTAMRIKTECKASSYVFSTYEDSMYNKQYLHAKPNINSL